MPWTPPPNWPAPPSPGWYPPPGWLPPPEWGPPPAGWNFWPGSPSGWDKIRGWVVGHKRASAIIGGVVLVLVIVSAATGGGSSKRKPAVDAAVVTPSATPTPAPSPTPTPTPTPKPTRTLPPADRLKFDAKDLCQRDVKELLKAPDTAKFDTAVVTNTDPTHYFVNGLVSAENGFGALIQSGYHCSAHYLRTDSQGDDHFFIRPRIRNR